MFRFLNELQAIQKLRAELFWQDEKPTKYSFKDDFRDQKEYPEGFQYKTGFIFFLDILGSRGLALKSREDELALYKIKKIVELFQDIEKQYEDEYWGSHYWMPFTHDGFTVDRHFGEEKIEVRLSLFSDSIIISYYPKIADRFVIWYEQMFQIFNDISKILYIFASNGIFLRGGMSYGKFYHMGSVCYGPALLEAIRLEGEVCYPTVAICDTFRKRIRKDLASKEIDDYMPGYKHPHELAEFASDFFSIFLNVVGANEQAQVRLGLNWLTAVFYHNIDRIDVMKNAITAELEKPYPERIKEKYLWLAKQFNYSLSLLKSLGLHDSTQKQIQF